MTADYFEAIAYRIHYLSVNANISHSSSSCHHYHPPSAASSATIHDPSHHKHIWVRARGSAIRESSEINCTMPDTRGGRGAAKPSGGNVGNGNEYDKKWNEKYHQLKIFKEKVCIKYSIIDTPQFLSHIFWTLFYFIQNGHCNVPSVSHLKI